MEKGKLIEEINRLKKERNAIILAHYYTEPDVQDIADFVGDSLALSQVAAENDADMIVFAGVNFMAETAKILSPEKTVLLPDTEAGCSLADSCRAEDLERFIEEHPGNVVISYVNTFVDVKALTDIACTSSNAVHIVNSVPKEQGIIFAPDRNLGSYIKNITGRENMLIWDGACHVHDRFSLDGILKLKKQHPNAKILTHPESREDIIAISDHVGSTSSILNFARTDDAREFIIVTETGILHALQTESPDKTFYPAPGNVSEEDTCYGRCNNCKYMKMVTLENIYTALRDKKHEVYINEDLRRRAEGSIRRMLELSC